MGRGNHDVSPKSVFAQPDQSAAALMSPCGVPTASWQRINFVAGDSLLQHHHILVIINTSLVGRPVFVNLDTPCKRVFIALRRVLCSHRSSDSARPHAQRRLIAMTSADSDVRAD